ncbi:hypothetical protein ACFVU3_36250 [Streptomyces sp. NPDC058052]|uniref:hypothetical protein n=1 Tax=Streptomyces sp. NPDC058052 TaxID=3346316 RepID=UPI0036EB416E
MATRSGDASGGISRLQPSLRDAPARQEANERRDKVKQFEQRTGIMRLECDAAYAAVREAAGTDAAQEKNAIWAAKQFARAKTFERLAAIEEPAADRPHRAAQLRTIAEDSLRRTRLGSEDPTTTQNGALP